MISEVRDKVKKFLEEVLEAEGIRIVRVDKAEGGWVAEAEVAEKNQYLASIQPEYRVYEKEHYIIRLNRELEIYSYKRLRANDETREGSNNGF